MSRLQRPLLLGLLCLLVLSWGTCPCVLSRVFASETEETMAPAVGCPCCQKRLEEEAASKRKAADQEKAPGPCHPEECPCCARDGAHRDLPPAGQDLVIPAMSTDCDLWFPELHAFSWLLPEEEKWHLQATGPPSALSPYGCPVGIVRLLN